MALGGTAKKIRKLADLGEKTYARIDELREQVAGTRDTVDDTNRRLREVESELAEQRAVLEALAEAEGVDVESLGEEPAESEAAAEG